GGALPAPAVAHRGLARGGGTRARRADERPPAADPGRRRRDPVGGVRAAGRARRAPQHPGLQHLHGQGRAVRQASAASRDRGLMGDMRRIAPDDTLMITDTGNHQTWVEQYWDAYEPRSVFTPGGFAGMGFGTCGVLGLKLGAPDRPAVCATSDGSFSMFPHAV